MFTGLIEDVGEVLSVERTAAGLRVGIGTRLGREIAAGDSLAVNGVCLTAVNPDPRGFHADVSPATIAVSTLGSLISGARVNLERAMPAEGRFGGHMVQGHVDGLGAVTAFTREGDHHWLVVDVPPALEPYLVEKGSLAVDGISLTIARLHATHAGMQIVPHTLAHTTLGAIRPGDAVNVECDIIGKYVVKAVHRTR